MIKKKRKLNISKNKWEPSKSSWLPKFFGLLIVIFVSFCYSTYSGNFHSGSGAEIHALTKRREELSELNEQLGSEVATLGSLSRIRESAKTDLKMIEGADAVEFLLPAKLAAR